MKRLYPQRYPVVNLPHPASLVSTTTGNTPMDPRYATAATMAPPKQPVLVIRVPARPTDHGHGMDPLLHVQKQ